MGRILQDLVPQALLVFPDLLLQRHELRDTFVDLSGTLVEDLEKFRKDLPVIALLPVDFFEFDHLREGEAEHLQAVDEFQSADVVVGIDALAVLDPADAVQEPDLLVVADRSLGQIDHAADLPDRVGTLGALCHISPPYVNWQDTTRNRILLSSATPSVPEPSHRGVLSERGAAGRNHYKAQAHSGDMPDQGGTYLVQPRVEGRSVLPLR